MGRHPLGAGADREEASMIAKRSLVVVLAGAALIAAGCGSSNKSSNTVPAKPSKSKPAMMSVDTGARLAVVTPNAGVVVRANNVPFDVAISHFKVDCRFAGTPNRAGVGHYHVELDGALVNMFCRDRDRVSLQNVAPGKHTLKFIPADNQHAPTPHAQASVKLNVR